MIARLRLALARWMCPDSHRIVRGDFPRPSPCGRPQGSFEMTRRGRCVHCEEFWSHHRSPSIVMGEAFQAQAVRLANRAALPRLAETGAEIQADAANACRTASDAAAGWSAP